MECGTVQICSLLIWLVFFYPLRKSLRTPPDKRPLHYLYTVNFAMAIAAISNSGFFKHQVAAVLLLSLSLVLVRYQDAINEI